MAERCTKLVKRPHDIFMAPCSYDAVKGGRCKRHQPEVIAAQKHRQSKTVIFKTFGIDIDKAPE